MKFEKWKQRIINIMNKLYEGKAKIITTFILLTFVVVLGLSAIYTLKDRWENFWQYPEESYQILEREANFMILNQNFDSRYEYTIQYNNKTNELNLTLFPNSESIKTTVKVINYGKSAQTIFTKRAYNSKFSFRTHRILIFIITCSIIAIFIYVLPGAFFILIFALISLLQLCYEQFMKIKNKKKDKE